MVQQLAVEWFWNKIALKLSVDQINEFLPELKQANIIMKEQIVDAATWGALAETGEQYYKEKYNK